MVPIPIVHAGMDVVLASQSLPLALEQVPMNRGYGIRIRKAHVLKSNWYAIKRSGGWVLFVLGLLLVLFSYISIDLAPDPSSLWAPVFLVWLRWRARLFRWCF